MWAWTKWQTEFIQFFTSVRILAEAKEIFVGIGQGQAVWGMYFIGQMAGICK